MATQVKTFSFASSGDSWTATAATATVAFTSGDGNPAGSWSFAVSGRNTKDDTGSYISWTGTFEDLGVPSGSTITGYSAASYDHKCSAYNVVDIAQFGFSTNGSLVINDGTARTLVGDQSFTGTTSWANKSASPAISGLSLPSTTSVTLYLYYVLDLGNNSSAAATILADNISVSIEYSASALNIDADYVGSSSSVNQPTITTLATIQADYLGSSSQVYQASVTNAASSQNIDADYLASASQVYEPTLDTVTVVQADYVPSASSVYQPTIDTVATIEADYVPSAALIYQPSFSSIQNIDADYVPGASQVYQPTATAEQTIDADYLASAAQVYQPTVNVGQSIQADYVASVSAVHEPTLDTIATIQADYLASSSTVYQPTVTAGQTIEADYLSSSAQVFDPVLNIAQTINADHAPSASQVHEPTISSVVTLYADHLPSSSQVFEPGVELNTQVIEVDFIAGYSVVYQPKIDGGTSGVGGKKKRRSLVILPDGTPVEVDSKEDAQELLEAWYLAHKPAVEPPKVTKRRVTLKPTESASEGLKSVAVYAPPKIPLRPIMPNQMVSAEAAKQTIKKAKQRTIEEALLLLIA